jgi:predicted nucleotidyltransferase component of viral defense system
MRLHDDIALFKDAVTATAQQMNLPEVYVEKDYWVTYALKTIFTSDARELSVFKGGTALSKCYKSSSVFLKTLIWSYSGRRQSLAIHLLGK